MSLHNAAQHLAAQGRGPDTTLVHMAPSEVKSLQALAMANGGSLTINPETGLPEAGFLSKLLPMAIGAGLAAATGGTSLAATGGLFGMGMPATIGLGVGAFETARTGSLQKGLMAGLGAYGGAGMAGGLSALGTSQAADVASNAVPHTNLTGIDALDMQTGALPDYNAKVQLAREAAIKQAQATPFQTLGKGVSAAFDDPSKFLNTMPGKDMMKYAGAMALPALTQTTKPPEIKTDNTPADKMVYNPGRPMDSMGQPITPMPDVPDYGVGLGQDFGRQQNFFPNAGYTTPVIGQKRFAAGGMPVEEMSRANALGMNTGYPQADITGHAYATASQTPISQNVVQGTADTGVNRMTGQMLATGGISDAHYNLGGYSDGGRLLRGPGDGVSDSIPAVIGKRQPARLADGEFVVPARIVSELGNGSTEAGARKLYAMMDRVQKARGKTVGKGRVAKNTRADRFLPA